MRWRVVLELAGADGTREVHEVGVGERPPAGHTAATLGLGLEEGKAVLAAVQRHLVTAQVDEHCRSRRHCDRCGAQRPLKDCRPRRLIWDCLMFGGQAAAAKVGWVSFAGANLCPKAEPKVPLYTAQRTCSRRSAPRRVQRICCDLFIRRFTRKLAVPSVMAVPTRRPAR